MEPVLPDTAPTRDMTTTPYPRRAAKPTDAELENRFIYHRPTGAKVEAHERVTQLTLALAKQLRDICPEGRNLSLALTHLEDVRMRANASIACDWV